jgi:hypothetical protein
MAWCLPYKHEKSRRHRPPIAPPRHVLASQVTDRVRLDGLGVGVGLAVGVNDGLGVGLGVGEGVGLDVGVGVGVGLDVGVGVGVGLDVGVGVGVGVGGGVGAAITSSTPSACAPA